jgi:amino acid transporter
VARVVVVLAADRFCPSQRFFWAYWCNDRDDSVVNQTVLTGIYFCLWILLVLLFTAYYYEGCLYALGSIWVFVVFAVYLFLMKMLLVADRFVSTFEERSFYWSIYQQGMYLLTLGINLFFGLVALADALRHGVTYGD